MMKINLKDKGLIDFNEENQNDIIKKKIWYNCQ